MSLSLFDFAYWASFALVVAANSCYHFLSKRSSPRLNPFLGLGVSYAVALLGSAVLFCLTRSEKISLELGRLGPSNFLLGAAILCVESGWLLMYRLGWKISEGSITANVCVAATLFLIGAAFMGETFSSRKAAGLLVCALGVFLIGSS